jgi:AcrR family transcriptional regulator
MTGRKRVSESDETGSSPGGRRGPKAQRGEVADLVLSSARASFATRGYAGTTMRSVAVLAGVDPALVTYYFSSKEGLLAAALEPPPRMGQVIAAAAAAPIRKRGKALVEALVSQWEDPAFADISRSIILTAAHEQIAMERLRQVFAVSILAAVSENLDAGERFLRVGLVASQMIGVAMARYVWQVGALAELPPEDVVRYVAPTVQRYLSGTL